MQYERSTCVIVLIEVCKLNNLIWIVPCSLSYVSYYTLLVQREFSLYNIIDIIDILIQRVQYSHITMHRWV